jgi:hypothetical protein
LLSPLVSVVQCGCTGVTPVIHDDLGTQLLAVIHISVPQGTGSVYEFKHGLGAMDSIRPSLDV